MKRHERYQLLKIIAATVIIGQGVFCTAQAVDLLRSVTLTIDGYTTGTPAYPETFTTASQVLGTLSTKRNLLFHMETLRRSEAQLPDVEKTALLARLMKRYQASDEDPVLFFDHGYAQLVFNHNKTGLFFLRKANDRIQDQFSAMAYAMAQAEVDLNEEAASPTEVNQRKMSVANMMKDAAKRDAETPKPGFWPSFLHVIAALKAIPAYSDLTGTDFSMVMVPYGNTSLVSDTSSNSATAIASTEGVPTSEKPEPRACIFDNSNTNIPNPKTAVTTKHADLNNDGSPETIRFFETGSGGRDTHHYQVVVTDAQNHVLANFTSPVAPYIIEDLDGDKVYEFVIRQARIDPYHPVVVYRYDGCQYAPDEDTASLFR